MGDGDVLAGTDGTVAPPVRMTVTVWWDRPPELERGGLADYLAYAALMEVMEPLQMEVLSRNVVIDDEDEGDDD